MPAGFAQRESTKKKRLHLQYKDKPVQHMLNGLLKAILGFGKKEIALYNANLYLTFTGWAI